MREGRKINDCGVSVVLGVVIMLVMGISTAGTVAYYVAEQTPKGEGCTLYDMIDADRQASLGGAAKVYAVYVIVIDDSSELPLENAYCKIIKNYNENPETPVVNEGYTNENGEWSSANMEHIHNYGLVVTLYGYETGIEIFDIDSSDVHITARLVGNLIKTTVEINTQKCGLARSGMPLSKNYADTVAEIRIGQSGNSINHNDDDGKTGNVIDIYPDVIYANTGDTIRIMISVNPEDEIDTACFDGLIWDQAHLKLTKVERGDLFANAVIWLINMNKKYFVWGSSVPTTMDGTFGTFVFEVL